MRFDPSEALSLRRAETQYSKFTAGLLSTGFVVFIEILNKNVNLVRYPSLELLFTNTTQDSKNTLILFLPQAQQRTTNHRCLSMILGECILLMKGYLDNFILANAKIDFTSNEIFLYIFPKIYLLNEQIKFNKSIYELKSLLCFSHVSFDIIISIQIFVLYRYNFGMMEIQIHLWVLEAENNATQLGYISLC